MGNKNTSDMREQDNSAVEAPEEVLQGAGANADGVEGEKLVSLTEDRDFHEKVKGLVSEVQSGAEEVNVLYQTSNQSYEERSEIHPSTESLGVEAASNEVGEGDTKLPCLSKEVEHHEKQKEFDLVRNLSGESNHQPEKQTTVEKEEEGPRITTFAAISATLDAEPQESLDTKPDQRKLANNHANSCVENDNEAASSTGSEISHPSVTDHSNYLEGDGVANTNLSNSSLVPQKEQVSSEEKRVDGGDNDGNDMTAENNGIETKCNGDFFTEMNLAAVLLDKPVNCHQEVSAPENESITFIEEAITIGNFSGNESKKNDQNPNKLREEATESTIGKEQAPKPELNTSELKYENEELSNLESQNNVPENGYPNEVMLPIDLTGKLNEMGVAQEIEDKTESSFSIKDDTKAREVDNQCPFLPLSPENGEAFDLGTPVSVHNPYHIDDIVLESETVKSSIEYSYVSPVKSQDHQEDTLTQSWSGQGGSGALLAEAPAESVQSQDQQDTAVGAEAAQNSNERFLPQASTQEQENVMATETRPSGNDFNIELKQKSGGDGFSTKALMIDPADLITDILVSELKFAIDQIGKDTSKDIAIALETSLEAKTAQIQSSEQSAIAETHAFANNGCKAQEGPRRSITESKPDDLGLLAVPAQIQKSPSFNFDIRLAAINEESDQTPLLYHDKRNSVRLLKPMAHSGHSPDSLQYQAMPMEERVITLDRSDYDKSRTPFLGFKKEEEEKANIVVTATAKKETKVASTSPKTKEKHKRRTSLFSNCMCCATVIN